MIRRLDSDSRPSINVTALPRQAEAHNALATSKSTNSVVTSATLRWRNSFIVCRAALCSSSLVLTSAIQAAVSTSTVGITQLFRSAINVVVMLTSEIGNTGVDFAFGKKLGKSI